MDAEALDGKAGIRILETTKVVLVDDRRAAFLLGNCPFPVRPMNSRKPVTQRADARIIRICLSELMMIGPPGL